jgi:hypothetical protein
MTVKENLEMGAFLRKDRENVQKDLERIYKRIELICITIFPITIFSIQQYLTTLRFHASSL